MSVLDTKRSANLRTVVGVSVIVLGTAGAWYTLRSPPGATLRFPDITQTLMVRVDTNGDGLVDGAEFALVAAEGDSLTSYDTDGDGVLSPNEVETSFLRAPPIPARLRGADGLGAGGRSQEQR